MSTLGQRAADRIEAMQDELVRLNRENIELREALKRAEEYLRRLRYIIGIPPAAMIVIDALAAIREAEK